jgi:ABC-type branched-subunit amino acid transport system substrate-binding protein
VRRVALLGLVAVLGASGCSTFPELPRLPGFGEATAPAEDRKEYDAAAALAKSNPEQAKARLEALAQKDPKSDLADEIALSLAQIHRAKRDDARAAAALERGLEAQPQGNRSDEIRFELAQLEVARGRKETAYVVLAAIRLQNLPAGQRREALRMLVDLARARRDRVAEIVWLAKLRAEAADLDGVRKVDGEIDERIADLSRPELERVAERLEGAVPAGRVRIREAELGIQLGQLEAASGALAKASELALTKPDAARLSKAEAALVAKGGRLAPKSGSATARKEPEATPKAEPAPGGALRSIGVVLPLSGRYAKFGEESLSGVLLAAGVFEPTPPPGTSEIRILVRDSASAPDAAAAAVTELAADPSVAAVIGPLLAEEAESAASAAATASLALLTLSAKEGTAGAAEHVYRFGATPRSEAEGLAQYAIVVQGLRRFAILHPEDNFGRGLRDLFAEAVARRGATIVKVQGYDVSERDLSAAVSTLLASTPKPVGAIAPFDAIFVPDTRQRGIAVAQALGTQKATGVRVLGARGWQSPELVRSGGTAIEGAIFSEPFDPGSSSPTVAEFMRRYHLAYGKSPDVMAAQAYDAARVLLSALPPGTTDRSEVEERLRRVRGYPGAAGTITLLEDGTVQKTPAIRGVRDGRIVELQ